MKFSRREVLAASAALTLTGALQPPLAGCAVNLFLPKNHAHLEPALSHALDTDTGAGQLDRLRTEGRLQPQPQRASLDGTGQVQAHASQ